MLLACGNVLSVTSQIRSGSGLRPAWDPYHMGVAVAVKERADCGRRMVGCVIVDTDHRVISTGFNGSPPDEPGCLSDGACPRLYSNVPAGSSYDNCISLHAEVNAVANGEASRMKGGTLYCTHEPCDWCTKVIKAARIARIVYLGGEGELVSRDI